METPAAEEVSNIFSLPTELHYLIFSYLSLNDLKELRLSCTRFNNEVIESSTFKQRSKIRLIAKDLFEVAENIQRNKRLNFRNVDFFKIDECPEIAFIMDAISMDVHELYLLDSKFYETLGSVELPNLERLEVVDLAMEGISNWKLDGYKNLNSVNIAELDPEIHNYILEELNKSVPGKLKSLSVRQYEDDETVTNALKLNAKALNDLYINFYDIPPTRLRKECKEIFQNMNSLRSLEMNRPEFICDIIAALPETTQLNSVIIEGDDEMSHKTINLIGKKFGNTIKDAKFQFLGRATRSTIEEFLRVTVNLKKLSISSFCDSLRYFTIDIKSMLQELNLSDLEELTEDCVCNLAKKLLNLEHLNISSCNLGTTNKSLAYIFRYQTSLRTLSLEYCHEITDEGLMGLGEKDYWPLPMPITRLKNLERLKLNRIGSLTNEPFYKAIAFKELRKFHLCDSENITNEAIVSLTKNCPAIENLYLSVCPKLTVDALNIVAAGLKRLRKFDIIRSNQFTSEMLDNFHKMNPIIKGSIFLRM